MIFLLLGKTSESQEANETVLDESQLSVVALPPTPYKPDQDDTQSSSSPEENVSSQILPLHRLSGSSLPQPQGGVIVRSSHSKLAQQVLCRNKPVAEVSPFSNNKVMQRLSNKYESFDSKTQFKNKISTIFYIEVYPQNTDIIFLLLVLVFFLVLVNG